MKQILDKRDMTPEAWQEYRRTQKGIGGSDCAIIMGLNPWKTPFTLWLEMTGQVEPKALTSESVEWGNRLEPVIREKFAQATGFLVHENPYVLQSEEHEFMVANVDGECFDPDMGEWGVLEIKTTDSRYKGEWEDGPPNHYHLQIQHYLAVMDYNYAYVSVLIGGNDFRYFKILRDDYIIDKIISAEKDFWELVMTGYPPEITGQQPDSNYLADTYPNDNGDVGELRTDLEALAIRYTELQKDIKLLQEESDYIKNRVKLEAKEYRVLESDKVKVSMPTINKVIFDSKLFASEHPELYEQYKNKHSSYRNFTVKIRRE
jgi:putative phage-type endonuclease